MRTVKKTVPTDKESFLDAMSDVQPLKPDNRLVHVPQRPDPTPRQRIRDEKAVLDELLQTPDEMYDLETGEELLYLRPDFAPRLLRRLRRGHYSIGDSIDLHQMGEDLAREVLFRFLEQSVRNGLGSVRIVHGKGLHSRGMPKLKIMTNRLLRRYPAVIAFASCQTKDGGTGAVNVLFRSAQKKTP
jgi:DNA-nicking Smr family endonuclease